MTQLIILRYTATMNRMTMLFSVVLIVFATSGIHKIIAAERIEQASMQSLSRTVVVDLVQNVTDADCCAEMSLVKHSPHDHCNMTCAILPNANRVERNWKIGTISEFRTDTLVDNPLDLMERPPRILI